MTEHVNDYDKIEKRKREKEERIEALKAKNGGKKPIRIEKGLGKILFPVVTVVVILLFVVWLGFSTGFIPSRLTPLSIGDEKISMARYNFNYNMTKRQYDQFVQYGMAPAGPDGKLDLSQVSTLPEANGQTWGKYLLAKTDENLKQQVVLNKWADEVKFELTAEEIKQVDDQLERFKNEAGDQLSLQLRARFGEGMTLEALREFQLYALRAALFSNKHLQSYQYDDAALTAQYEKEKNKIDQVSFRHLTWTVPQQEKDEAIKKETQAENEKKATEMLEKLETADQFYDLAKIYASESQRNLLNASEANTEAKDLSYAQTQATVGTAGADWLFDASRKAGDKTLVKNNDNEVLLFFEAKLRPEYQLPSVRHLLLTSSQNPDANSSPVNEADKALAEEIAARVKSEEDLIKEADELKKQDRVRESSRYDQIPYGQMVKEFNNWIYAPERKSGDVGVVLTQYGYHVIYFIEKGEEPQWKYQARQQLASEQFKKELDEKLADAKYAAKPSTFAQKYVSIAG